MISASLLYKSEIESIEERDAYFKVANELRSNISNINKEDRLSQLAINEKFILTVTSKGFGQLSSFYDYRQISRGTQGCQNMTLSKKNGTVIASFPVNRDDQIILLTNTGRILRCSVSEIRITRRGAKGVILFRLNDKVSENENEELVTSVSRIDSNISNTYDNNTIDTTHTSKIEYCSIEDNNKEDEPLLSTDEDYDSLDDIFGDDK